MGFLQLSADIYLSLVCFLMSYSPNIKFIFSIIQFLLKEDLRK